MGRSPSLPAGDPPAPGLATGRAARYGRQDRRHAPAKEGRKIVNARDLGRLYGGRAAALVAGLCGALLWAGGNARGAAAPPRPNFVIIVADALSWDDVAAFGNARIRTPHLDRLARDGLRFDRAFLTISASGPSRASILTGRYPHAAGTAEPHLPLPGDQVLLTQPLHDAGYFTAAAGKWDLGPAAKTRFDVIKEGGGAGGYADWLPVLRDRPAGRPFFLWLASTDPRRPFRPAATHEPFRPEEVAVPPFLPDVADVRQDLAQYYDAVGRLDHHVGLLLAELERQQLTTNTVVVFLADNGRPFPRCQGTVLEAGLHVPLMIRWSKAVNAGSVTQSLVSAIDLAPTIVDLAGLKAPPSFQGKSFARLLTDGKAEIRPLCFAEHNWYDYAARERAVRSKDFLYIRNDEPQLPRTPPSGVVRSPAFQSLLRLQEAGKLTPAQSDCCTLPRPAEELYDLRGDPAALHNVVGEAKYAEPLEALRAGLARWRVDTADIPPLVLTPDKFDRATGMGLGAKSPPNGKRGSSR